MKAKQILTCKEHSFAVREVFPTLPNPVLPALEAGETVKDHLGFGVAITPSSCYVLSQMEPAERRALLKRIYTHEGTNLSIGRLCIGACDYSPEIYSYDDVAGDTALEHFSIERDERYVIPMIKEILSIRPDLFLFASPWSPPAWMKTGESFLGGYMRECYLECYAEYFVKFIRAYAAHGIKISAVTIQNEPETQQQGLMPSCIWHPETEAKFACALRRHFDTAGIDTRIWLFDHSFRGAERVRWQLAHCEGVKDACAGLAFHYYDGAIEETACLKSNYPSLPLHFTEAGPRLTQHYESDHCKWALMIARAFKMGYRSFTGWNLLLDEFGGPCVGLYSGICGGLVTRDSRDGALSYSGQYAALRHIAPYITESAQVRYLRSVPAYGTCMSLYPASDEIRAIEGIEIENSDGRHIAVVINPNVSHMQAHVMLGGTRYYLDLPAESVSTVIAEE